MTPQPSPTAHAPAWRTAPASRVKARIANGALQPLPSITIGDITLFPHQADAVLRLRAILREFHGALLADDVGLGKTYIALALAAQHRVAHVIAPAALLPMWRHAIERTACTHVTLHSLHRYSRASRFDTQDLGARGLIIIDEAHHLRSRTTKRYHAVARFVAGHDVVLMTATPVHNNVAELEQLLALFAGGRSDLLEENMLAQLIVRRTHASYAPTRPAVHEHVAYDIPHDRATLSAILTLPAPLAAHNGAVSGALIRLGLLRAWCSSDAALAHAVRRRLLRGEALRQALLAGRHPTNAELRSWLVGDHEVQLAFPELLADQKTESGAVLDILERHLDALVALEAQHRHSAHGDAERAQRLRQIVAERPGVPVVAFSQFAQTVHALYRALADIAGVGALTGSGGRIASGPVSREHVLNSFAPVANGRPPPPSHQAISLLITTDLLAEGVNLHDAGIVVHCDLPWTDALRVQRVGRCARIGSPHAVVHVFQLGPPSGSAHVLRLAERLAIKAGLAEQFVGVRSRTPGFASARHRHSAADVATMVQDQLRSWSDAAHTQCDPLCDPLCDLLCDPLIVGVVSARRRGFLALLTPLAPPTSLAASEVTASAAESGHVLAHLESWRLPRDDAGAVWRVLRQIGPNDEAIVSSTERPGTAKAIARSLHQVERWQDARRITSLLGTAPTALSSAQQRAAQVLVAVVGELPSLQRVLLRHAIDAAHRAIRTARTVAAQQALDVWLKSRTQHEADPWLRLCPPATQHEERLHTSHEAQANPDCGHASDTTATTDLHVSALLLLSVTSHTP